MKEAKTYGSVLVFFDISVFFPTLRLLFLLPLFLFFLQPRMSQGLKVTAPGPFSLAISIPPDSKKTIKVTFGPRWSPIHQTQKVNK